MIMADPLSLESSIASLISVGTRISTQLQQFLDDGSAQSTDDISELATELTDLCRILKQLQDAFGRNNGSVYHRELWLDFRNVLASCMDKFVQLRMLVSAHEVNKSDEGWSRKWRCWNRTFQEKEVSMLKVQLEAHKATLSISLLLSDDIEPTSVKDTTDMIETTAREIIGRLTEEADGETTSTKYQDSSILQRYLTSASSVVSSRTTSPAEVHPEEATEPHSQHPPIITNTPTASVIATKIGKKVSLSELKNGGRRPPATTPSRPPSYIPTSPLKSSSTMSTRPPPPPRHKTDPSTTPKSLHARTLSLPTNKTISALPRPSPVSTKLPISTSHTRTASLPSNKTPPTPRPLPLPPPSPSTTLFAKLAASRGKPPPSPPPNLFADELTTAYNEPTDTHTWCHPTTTRTKCTKEQESAICNLYLETLGDQRDMEKTKAMFKQKEAWTKLKATSEKLEKTCANLFRKIWSKLQEGITRLANMYNYFELMNDNSVAVPEDTMGVWVSTLTRLLKELLHLRKRVQARHERVQGVFVERDMMYTRAIRTITVTLLEMGVIGRVSKPCSEDTKLVAKQFEMTLEYAQQSVAEAGQSILSGLDLSFVHIEKVVDATKDLIPAFGIVSRGTISPKRRLPTDPRVIEELKVTSVRINEGFQRVSHVMSLGTMEVVRGESRLAERPDHLDKRIYVEFKGGKLVI